MHSSTFGKLLCKGQASNILGFVAHLVSSNSCYCSLQYSYDRAKAAIVDI